MTIPAFGLGTFRLKDQAVTSAVSHALDLGYRAIDTAQIYGNEADIGMAIRDSGIDREELFLTTKIWVDNYSAEKLVPSLKDSLQKLQTEHVNLTLIHWPAPNNGILLSEFMQALLEAKKLGLTHQIGISNFNIELTQQAIAAIGVEHIATNQVELHPYLQNRQLAEFSRSVGIPITSYMTLAYGKVIHDPVLEAIANQYHATTAQVALAWALKSGYAVIPSSTKREHLSSNLRALELELSEQDMQNIAQLDRHERLVNPDGLAPQWDE